MPQGVLNFSVEGTKESLTSNAGTILFGEYLKAIKIDKMCNTYLPLPQSNRGYTPFEHMQPLLLMLHSGGRVLDDLRMIHKDKAIKETLNIKRMPISEVWVNGSHVTDCLGYMVLNPSIVNYCKDI